jgi:thioredoxin-like negative regulator of GroEL
LGKWDALPERIAAARSLVERAVSRHPRHPDLAFYLTVDLLLQGDLESAEESLDSLPEPLPWRLQSSSVALRARMRLQQGRVDEALALLSDWMDRYPRDTTSVAVLLEVWNRLERPDDATMIMRLQAARSRLHPPSLSAQIEQTLQQLLARAPVGAGSN